MKCDRKDCNGVHGHKVPYSTWCQGAKDKAKNTAAGIKNVGKTNKCDRKDCNGIHGGLNASTGKRQPYNKWCEGAKEKKRLSERNQMKTPGTYHYDRVHGLGKAGETAKKNFARRRKTVDTYEYNAAHGIGEPGEKRRQRENKSVQTPGSHKYKAVHGIGKPGLNKYISDRKIRLNKQKQNNIKKLQELEKEIENGR